MPKAPVMAFALCSPRLCAHVCLLGEGRGVGREEVTPAARWVASAGGHLPLWEAHCGTCATWDCAMQDRDLKARDQDIGKVRMGLQACAVTLSSLVSRHALMGESIPMPLVCRDGTTSPCCCPSPAWHV